ncbi:helix-turn-helix domain-containing protein [Sphingomonas sp. G124]|uniref:Helix-turn-helix domain-containing protein n=1 Tax=Sphingomonas cremea TaxID=2904799 RepID=A0A9X1QL59_9SPHN|nr:MerR family transcriptional regulator [Sphingomonas cremea]MCF2514544.1 helix-turn-helix domain-containing protein [Sphingomonas cremea]
MTDAINTMLHAGRCEYAEYSPGELQRISGLTTDLQRVWRRRGQLVPHRKSGHAKFSPLEVVEITIRYALSKLGIPPGECELDLFDAFSGALFHALLNVDGACEVFGPSEDVDSFLADFAESGRIAHYLAGSPSAANYLVVNEAHEVRIVDDPQYVFDKTDPFLLVVDLELIGGRLVERGRKPIVAFYLPERKGTRTVRRLTGLGANDC